MTTIQSKIHELLQLAMECERHCVGVSYCKSSESIYMHVYNAPYEIGAPMIHSDQTYADNMLGDAQEALDRMIQYVQELS